MTTPTLRLPIIPGADSSCRSEARTPGVKSVPRVLIRSSLVLATALALMACGSSSTAARHTPSPSASAGAGGGAPASTPGAFPSRTPGAPGPLPPASFSCSSAIPPAHQLALVQLKGVSGYVVRDITDILHPVTRCTFHGGGYFRFISETRLSYVVTGGSNLGAPGALYLADLSSGSTSLVRAWTYGGYASWIYAWSPDGSRLTYLSSDQTGLQWHMLSAAGDRLLASLGQVAPRGVNNDNDDAMVGFTADGQYVAVEQTFTQGKGTTSATPIQVNRVSDGRLAYSATDGTLAVWAGTGARLLFRTSAGVQAWAPSGGARPATAAAA